MHVNRRAQDNWLENYKAYKAVTTKKVSQTGQRFTTVIRGMEFGLRNVARIESGQKIVKSEIAAAVL